MQPSTSWPLPINRVLQCTVICGITGYMMSWLVHLFLKSFLRSASPFVIEGSIAAICGGFVATLLGLLITRSFSSPVLRAILCIAGVILIPIAIAAEGIGGMIAMGHALKACEGWIHLRPNQDHRIVPWGYYLLPAVGTIVLNYLICWCYRFRRGASLLCFDRATDDNGPEPNGHSVDRELRFVLRLSLLSAFVSWLVHLRVATTLSNFWGGQSCVEGAMIILASGTTAAISLLCANRLAKSRATRRSVCAVITLIIGCTAGLAGWLGIVTAIVLIRLANSQIDPEVAHYGYYVFPPLWASILAWGICWYYKATHGGASLLNFDPPGETEVRRG